MRAKYTVLKQSVESDIFEQDNMDKEKIIRSPHE